MTNAEYYKNCSFDELLNKFVAACADESDQTIQNFNEWRKAEHRCLVKGDVIIRVGNGSKVEVVVELDEVHNDITLCDLADYLSVGSPWHLKYSDCKLFTGKPICNINALIKDPSGKYHVIAKPSCPLVEPVKLTDLADTPKANKSKKDKILDYMEKVMLINSDDIDRLRAQSVEEIYTHTFHNVAYIFSVLYRVSPSKVIHLTDEFIYACALIAPKWYAMRKICAEFKHINNYELTTMLECGTVGYTGDVDGRMYKINGEIV